MEEQKITSWVFGIISIGLALVGLINPALRNEALAALTGVLALAIALLKSESTENRISILEKQISKKNTRVRELERKLDFHEKFFKLQQAVKQLEKMNKKGSFNPTWAGMILATLVLLYFILKATGVI